LLLGVVGFVFAELASIWLAGSPGTRIATGEPVTPADADGELSSSLRTRVPLLMAVWGFVFVAAGELLLYACRGNPRPPVQPPPPPDDAEKLLEELLRQADATAAQGSGAGSHESGEPTSAKPTEEGRASRILTPDS
jgi:hypothetical protein